MKLIKVKVFFFLHIERCRQKVIQARLLVHAACLYNIQILRAEQHSPYVSGFVVEMCPTNVAPKLTSRSKDIFNHYAIIRPQSQDLEFEFIILVSLVYHNRLRAKENVN